MIAICSTPSLERKAWSIPSFDPTQRSESRDEAATWNGLWSTTVFWVHTPGLATIAGAELTIGPRRQVRGFPAPSFPRMKSMTSGVMPATPVKGASVRFAVVTSTSELSVGFQVKIFRADDSVRASSSPASHFW